MALTRDQIKDIDDINIVETGDVPGWGDSVFIKPLTAKARDSIDSLVRKSNGDTSGFRVAWIILCVCDESGAPLFTQEDVPWLEEKSNEAIMYIWDEISKISGMSEDAVEEEVENS